MQAPVKEFPYIDEAGDIRLHQYNFRDKGLDVRKINLSMELLCRGVNTHFLINMGGLIWIAEDNSKTATVFQQV